MDPLRRVTLSDIAKETGVHVTTVSLAMRNHPRIPESTKTRIRAVAEKMGYVRDPMMQALVSYRTGTKSERRHIPTLAYLTNWSTRWGWKKTTAHPEFFEGAQAKARELGYKLDLFWLGEPGLTADRISSIFKTRGIMGLILASHGREMGDTLQLDWPRFSAVKIDYFPHEPMLHNVTNHQCDIVRLAFQKVRAAGYKRIGLVMHRGWDHAVDHYWTAGFLCEQQQVPKKDRVPVYLFPDMHPIENWFDEHKSAVEVDPDVFRAWYEKHQPDVIIGKTSFVANAMQKAGLRIPRDVSFVDLFLDNFDGSLAGVRQNHQTVGALAVEILSSQLQHGKFGIPEFPTTTFVEGTWFEGASCPTLKTAELSAS